MSEKKSSDDETPDQSLNDDFDFGEGETENRIAEPAPASGLNKKILGAMLVVVLGVLMIMGYKIFKPAPALKTTTTNNPATEKAIATTDTPTAKKIETIASHPVPAPAVTSNTVPVAAPSQTVTEHTSNTTEQNFGDIASAFSSGENATASPSGSSDKTTSPDQTAPKEGSIQSLKQDLFTPEKLPAPNSSATTDKTTPTANPVSPTHQEVVQLSDGLNKLNHQIEYILNQIKYLDSYSREVSDNLNKLNDSISAMDSRLSTLTNTTSTLSKDVGNVRSEVGQFKQVLKEDGIDMNLGSTIPKKKSAPKEGKISIEEPEYTVHAVIPGRAWLKSARGQIITVAEGDTIGNYGKILVIDAANGVVLTSSGIAFR